MSYRQAPASSGSRTETRDDEPSVEQRLRLRGAPEEAEQERPRVQWAEDTVDNENLGRKKSKVCCIFHPKGEFCESSEEESESEEYTSPSSSSSSSSESDSDSGIDASVPDSLGHNHNHHGHSHSRRHRHMRPNAYERQPRLKKKAH